MRSNAAEKIVTVAESSATARNAVRDACKELLSRAVFELNNMEEGPQRDNEQYRVVQLRHAYNVLCGSEGAQSYPEWGQRVRVHLGMAGTLAGDLWHMLQEGYMTPIQEETTVETDNVNNSEAIDVLAAFVERSPEWVDQLGRACLLLRETMGEVVGHDVFEVVAHRRTLALLWIDLDEAHHDPEHFGEELGSTVAATLGKNPATAVLLLDHLICSSLS